MSFSYIGIYPIGRQMTISGFVANAGGTYPGQIANIDVWLWNPAGAMIWNAVNFTVDIGRGWYTRPYTPGTLGHWHYEYEYVVQNIYEGGMFRVVDLGTAV